LTEWKSLLHEKGFTLKEVDNLFIQKIKSLENKKSIRFKDPASGFKGKETEYFESKVHGFVTLIQKSYPIKMFVLEEMDREEIRIGYYVVSLKKLKEKDKLSLMWGQFNPHIPKEDLSILLDKARKKGII